MNVPIRSSTNWWSFGNGVGKVLSPSDPAIEYLQPHHSVAITANTASTNIASAASVRLSDMAAATACLAMVNLLVLCGNVFVLYILISQKSLHTSTNFIVLSLTLSDFLLGVLILPFSILQEYSLTWMFGELWCKLWLALDVLLSTASIYNLLAISFDRYMAVRQPIKYRFISSNRMTKITIAIVWLIASALSLPPLIFDHFGTSSSSSNNFSMTSFIPITTSSVVGGQCTPATSSDWYIIFSAFVSFILPMFLMIGLNFSIFYTVSDSTKFAKIPNNKNFTKFTSSCDDVNSLFRIHRGGRHYNCGLSKNELLSCSQRSLNMPKKASLADFHHNTIDHSSIGSSRKPTYDTTTARNSSLAGSLNGRGASIDSATASVFKNGQLQRTDTFSISLDSATIASNFQPVPPPAENYSVVSGAKLTWLNRIKAINREKQQRLIEAERSSYHSTISSNYQCSSPPVNGNIDNTPTSPNSRILRHMKMEQGSISSATSDINYRPPLNAIGKSAVDHSVWYPAVVTTLLVGKADSDGNGSGKKSKEGLFLYPVLQQQQQHQQQLNRTSALRTELRVARTIGVVVGCFTACWLPFTIIYILQAYQTCPVGICIPNWFFTLAFWLGYSNSALNPLLYAAFSRDFRSAFRKVLMDRTSSFRSN